MLFSDRPRTHYNNAPVHEVICQLRFPTILSINTTEPADFQEMIRSDFPKYVRRQDVQQPRLVKTPAGPKFEQQPPITNYNFISEDGRWRINLTQHFISLSTIRYENWETFANYLDQALAAFIQLYKPAYFERVGLRYLNLFSRQRLDEVDTPWSELIAPAYLGVMQEPDVNESNVFNSGVDLLLKLDNSCQTKIHAGPGRLKVTVPNVPQDPETKFVFDMDLVMNGNTPCTLAAAGLETLHAHANRIFEGALTDRVRQAMMPE